VWPSLPYFGYEINCCCSTDHSWTLIILARTWTTSHIFGPLTHEPFPEDTIYKEVFFLVDGLHVLLILNQKRLSCFQENRQIILRPILKAPISGATVFIFNKHLPMTNKFLNNECESRDK
jgi:hypothetical protein